MHIIKIYSALSIPLIATLLTACAAETAVPLPREYMPVWSPDGRQIAFICSGDGPVRMDYVDRPIFSENAAEICVMDRDGANKRRLTNNQTADRDPQWSPNGRLISFASVDGLYVVDPQGSESPRRLFDGRFISDPNWSPDGSRLAFVMCGREQGADIYVIEVEGRHLTTLPNPERATLERPRWSSDDQHLAYSITSSPECTISPMIFATSYNLMLTDLNSLSSSRQLAGDLQSLRQIMWIDSKTLAYTIQSVDGFTLHNINLESDAVSSSTFSDVSAILYAWATDGHAYAFTTIDGLFVRDLRTDQVSQIAKSNGITAISWSPDNLRILFTSFEQVLDEERPLTSFEDVLERRNPRNTETIWVVNRDGAESRRLTELPSDSTR